MCRGRHIVMVRGFPCPPRIPCSDMPGGVRNSVLFELPHVLSAKGSVLPVIVDVLPVVSLVLPRASSLSRFSGHAC